MHSPVIGIYRLFIQLYKFIKLCFEGVQKSWQTFLGYLPETFFIPVMHPVFDIYIIKVYRDVVPGIKTGRKHPLEIKLPAPVSS